MGDTFHFIETVLDKERSIGQRSKDIVSGFDKIQARLKVLQIHMVKSVEEQVIVLFIVKLSIQGADVLRNPGQGKHSKNMQGILTDP